MEHFTPSHLLSALYEAGIRRDNFFLRMFITEVHTFAEKKVDLDMIPNKIPIAPFCSPQIAGVIDRNQGFSTKTFEPGYVKSKHAVDATQSVARLAGERPDAKKDPKDRHSAIIMQNMSNEEQAIQDREEWMAVQMVLNGRYLVDGPNIETPYEINAGRRAENNINLIGGEAWDVVDKSTYDVVEKIEDWAGFADGTINIAILDKKGWSLFRKFKSVEKALETRRGSNSELETAVKDLNKTVSYKGMLGDLAIVVVDEEYTDRDGTTKKHLPDNILILGNVSSRGLRLYGGIQDLQAVREGMAKAERYAKHWTEGKDPEVEFTKLEAAPAPYSAEPNSFVVIKLKPD